MRFIDEAKIRVNAGDGGRGCVSFRREKYVPRGGPDGGNGGKGGDVILVGDDQLESLIDFRYKRHYKTKSGAHGRGKDQHGKNGADLTLPLPLGTLVYDDLNDELLNDFCLAGEQIVVASGGLGGRGNASFKTSTRQAPHYAQDGLKGQERFLRLELKLLADVGIVGLPNSGKSTLISRVSAARPKIADYPFTTLNPNLGVVNYKEYKRFIFADIPGLIEGAHQGTGLGTDFLRHIERTRILIHLIDGSTTPPHNPVKSFETINKELKLYNPALADKPRIIAINKMDLPQFQENYPEIKSYFEDLKMKIFSVSAVTGEGISSLIDDVAEKLSRIKK
jgi:GTP-binding protein